MKVKCGICGREEVGRVHNLLKEWAIIFLYEGIRVRRCKECKPLLWDRKDNFKIFETEMDEELKNKKEKLKIIQSL